MSDTTVVRVCLLGVSGLTMKGAQCAHSGTIRRDVVMLLEPPVGSRHTFTVGQLSSAWLDINTCLAGDNTGTPCVRGIHV